MVPRTRRLGVRLAAVLLLTAAVARCGPAESEPRYAGTVEFPDVEVGSLIGGRVVRVLRQEGEEAAADDVLVELDPSEWRSNLEEAQALAAATERELALLEAGPRQEEIEEARAMARRLELLWKVIEQGSRPEEIEAAREEVKASAARQEEAKKNALRIADLVALNVETQATLDHAEALRDTAEAQTAAAAQRLQLLERGARPEEVEAARQSWVAQAARVKALESGSRPEEIAAKRAALEAARARIRAAQTRLDELVIRAPHACFVQTLDLRPGDLLRAGAPVAVLLLKDEPWTIVYVPERDLGRVRVGQRAAVRPDGHPPLAGKVTWISRRAEYTPRNVQTQEERTTQVFAVKVVIEGDTSRLKDGMWADVAFE